jgi:integrase
MARARRGRGEGSIYQRGDGLWVASISAGRTSSGSRRRLVAYGVTKKAAQYELQKLIGSATTDPSKLLVRDLAKRWLEAKKKTVTPLTYDRYEQIWRIHVEPFIGNARASHLKAWHIERFYSDLEKARAGQGVDERPLCSRAGLRKAGEVLHFILTEAARQGVLPAAPTQFVRRPKVEQVEMLVLSPEQVTTFLEHAALDPLHYLYLMALSTGMREGELFALEWKDVDFDSHAVTVQRTLENRKGALRTKPPKTKNAYRRIDLPEAMVDALLEHRRRAVAEGMATAPVFHDERGGWLRISNVGRRSLKPILERAGLPRIRFHDLRHTHATLLLVSGVNPKVVSERLGHASVEFTLKTYSHVLPTIQKDAAAKLNKLLA